MINLFYVWVLTSLAIYLTAAITPGFALRGFGSAMIASMVVGLLNMTIRPILWFLTLPINILTLGLFSIVLNAIILKMTAGLLKGFDIKGWLPAIVGAIVLAIVQALLFWIFGPSAYEVQHGAATV